MAFMFPGQGSFELGMGREIAEAEPEAMAVYDEGSEASGLDLKELCFKRPAEELDADRGAAACARRDEPRDRRGAARARDRPGLRRRPLGRRVLGARLGAARSRSRDTIALVRERGLAMADAAKEHPGSMAAILGLADEVVEALCEKIHNVWPANYNCPGQLVISGETRAVDECCEEAQREGARRAVRLQGLGRVPLAARRARRRAAPPGDREDRVQGAARAVRLDGHGEARGCAAVPRRCSSSS